MNVACFFQKKKKVFGIQVALLTATYSHPLGFRTPAKCTIYEICNKFWELSITCQSLETPPCCKYTSKLSLLQKLGGWLNIKPYLYIPICLYKLKEMTYLPNWILLSVVPFIIHTLFSTAFIPAIVWMRYETTEISRLYIVYMRHEFWSIMSLAAKPMTLDFALCNSQELLYWIELRRIRGKVGTSISAIRNILGNILRLMYKCIIHI